MGPPGSQWARGGNGLAEIQGLRPIEVLVGQPVEVRVFLTAPMALFQGDPRMSPSVPRSPNYQVITGTKKQKSERSTSGRVPA